MFKKSILSLSLLVFMGIVSFGQTATKTSPNPTAPAAPKPNPNAPELTFEETSFDFATLQKGDECSHEFRFKNTGNEPLILSNCQASCGCTTPTCPKEPIAPGASSVIKVRYDSNRVGVFSKTITVTSNAKNSPVTLSIKGKIEGPAQEEAFPGKNNSGIGQ
jgi:hypothetical protein